MTRRTLHTTAVLALGSMASAAALSLLPAAAVATESAPTVAVSPAPVAQEAYATGTGSAILASTPWETTGAITQDGEAVPLTDPAVAAFVGWAYYTPAGTFTMYNLDDSPKLRGDWSVDEDGSGNATRTLVAKNPDGTVQFTRTVPIVTLTSTEFTYRVIPDAAAPTVFFDIIHTPTNHPEPGSGSGVVPEPQPSPGAGETVDTAASPAVSPASDPATAELAETGSDGELAGFALVGALLALGAAAVGVQRIPRRTAPRR